jgi:hypothetical protein
VPNADAEMVAFARCLRSHGVDVPDPYHRPGHAGLTLDLPSKTPATLPALDTCQHLIGPIIKAKLAGMRQQAAPDLAALSRYAVCMRQRGVPMLDPTPQGQLDLGDVPGIANGFGRYTPQFRQADHQCRHLLPAGVADNGSGP